MEEVHGVGCAVPACACQLLFVDVDGDDGGCATELCACDCCVGADAAAADDCDGLAALELTGGSEQHPDLRAVTPQPSRPMAAYCSGLMSAVILVHWPAATRVFSAKEPIPSAGGELGVPSSRVIFWVALWVAKQYRRLALAACAAFAADCTPVEDDQVAGGDVGDVIADSLNDTCGLVAEQVGEVRPTPPVT